MVIATTDATDAVRVLLEEGAAREARTEVRVDSRSQGL
jgi:hypothetical protein